jgi:hypothetical protein
MNVSLAGSAELAEWQRFVDGRDAAGPFHHAAWSNVLADAFAVVPRFWIARDERGGIRGVLPGYLSRSPFTGSHVTSLDGGILADEGAVDVLAQAIRDEAATRGLRFAQLRGGPFPEPDGSVRTIHTLIDTGHGPDRAWAEVKTKTRWGVRQAERGGITIVRDSALERIDVFYDLYAEHMRGLGTPVFGRAFFRAMRRHLGANRMRLYLVESAGEAIGGMICVAHGRMWTDLYAVVRRSKAFEFANYLLYWHVIRDAAECGISAFDLGRSAPGSGVLLFKHKWGGRDEDVPYAFYAGPSAKKHAFGLVEEERRIGLRQKIWMKLPLAAANFAGPLVRRDLPFL